MKNIKLFILVISFGLVSSFSFSEEGEEEVVQPSNPQELLEIVKQGQFADTQQQRDREAQFRNEKNRQAKLLSDAKDERARLEREAARLEQKFEANEALLVVAEEQLRDLIIGTRGYSAYQDLLKLRREIVAERKEREREMALERERKKENAETALIIVILVMFVAGFGVLVLMYLEIVDPSKW